MARKDKYLLRTLRVSSLKVITRNCRQNGSPYIGTWKELEEIIKGMEKKSFLKSEAKLTVLKLDGLNASSRKTMEIYVDGWMCIRVIICLDMHVHTDL